jgi:hypothetical protein
MLDSPQAGLLESPRKPPWALSGSLVMHEGNTCGGPQGSRLLEVCLANSTIIFQIGPSLSNINTEMTLDRPPAALPVHSVRANIQIPSGNWVCDIVFSCCRPPSRNQLAWWRWRLFALMSSLIYSGCAQYGQQTSAASGWFSHNSSGSQVVECAAQHLLSASRNEILVATSPSLYGS